MLVQTCTFTNWSMRAPPIYGFYHFGSCSLLKLYYGVPVQYVHMYVCVNLCMCLLRRENSISFLSSSLLCFSSPSGRSDLSLN